MKTVLFVIHYILLVCLIFFVKDPVVGLAAILGMVWGWVFWIALIAEQAKKNAP